MDKDRIEGAATNTGGKIKEGLGNLTGDEKLRSEGLADQIKGKIQNTVGAVKDAFKGR
ncbi:CsbD family protein [Methylobacterium sp. ID0610]|uniref:CsbD family protein n=1 Tax=Methylobacterium carpenticola TaxID=3344827 RepID=UPI00367CB5EB